MFDFYVKLSVHKAIRPFNKWFMNNMSQSFWVYTYEALALTHT